MRPLLGLLLCRQVQLVLHLFDKRFIRIRRLLTPLSPALPVRGAAVGGVIGLFVEVIRGGLNDHFHTLGADAMARITTPTLILSGSLDAIVPAERARSSYDLLTEDAGYRIHGVSVNSMIEEMYAAGQSGRLPEEE